MRTILRIVTLALALVASAARPAAAAPNWWQVRLSDGTYIYELQLVELRGDTLVLSHADSVVRLSLDDIDELRWIRPSEMHVGGGSGRSTIGTLSGADDEVYQLGLVTPEERRRTVAQLVREHAVKPPTKSPSSKITKRRKADGH